MGPDHNHSEPSGSAFEIRTDLSASGRAGPDQIDLATITLICADCQAPIESVTVDVRILMGLGIAHRTQMCPAGAKRLEVATGIPGPGLLGRGVQNGRRL